MDTLRPHETVDGGSACYPKLILLWLAHHLRCHTLNVGVKLDTFVCAWQIIRTMLR